MIDLQPTPEESQMDLNTLLGALHLEIVETDATEGEDFPGESEGKITSRSLSSEAQTITGLKGKVRGHIQGEHGDTRTDLTVHLKPRNLFSRDNFIFYISGDHKTGDYSVKINPDDEDPLDAETKDVLIESIL